MIRWSSALAVLTVIAIAPAAHAVGEAKNGFPNWAERVELEWMNRARVEPSIEMATCGSRCGEAACYTPKPPLTWNENLNHAARFHSIHMKTNGYFQHDSKCALVSSLNTTYPTTCNGPASCSCVGGTLTGTTSPSARASIFGASWSGEIIASPSDPNSAFYLWLFENSTSTTCAFSSANGHRWLLLTSSTGAVGFGVDGYSTGDFGGGGTPYKIPSGSHYPRNGASVELWANWYDTAAPKSAMVNVGGTCYPMTRQRGTDLNGAWRYTATGLSGCTRYYFTFKDSAGTQIDYPTTGSLGVGDTTCADFDTTRPASGSGCSCTPSCSGKTCGPDGCGGSCGTCASGKTCSTAGSCADVVIDSGPPPDTSTPLDTSTAPDTSTPPPDSSVPEDTMIPLEDGDLPDGGAVTDDAAAIEDTAVEDTSIGDGGLETPAMDDGAPLQGSCGCRSPRTSPASPALLLGLIALALRRRR